MTALRLWKGAVQPAQTGWTQDEITGGTRTRTEGAVTPTGKEIYLYKGAVQPTESPTCTLACS